VHLENENNQQSVNVSRLILQRAKEKPKKKDEVEWELERIITSKFNQDGQEEVLVKWRGFTKRFNSWIPIKNLHADDMLQEFRSSRRGRPLQKKGGEEESIDVKRPMFSQHLLSEIPHSSPIRS